jgi:prepilin-type N-terminal cleavage/methylation domain-containing protein
MTRSKTHGFTLTELIIVIVVIGILATIALLSYSGIRQRADNTRRIVAARQAANLVQSYMSTYDAYPWTTSASMCIGKNFPGGKCWGVDSVPPSYPTLEADSGPLVNTLAAIGALSSIGYPAVNMGYWSGMGPVYHYAAGRMVDAQARPIVIVYFLDGLDQDCGMDNIVKTTDTGTAGLIENSLNYVRDNSIPRNTASNGSGTYCIVSLNSL